MSIMLNFYVSDNLIFRILILICFICISKQQLDNPSGNFCGTTVEKTNVTTVCNCTINIVFCCGYINITEFYNVTEYSCCDGWTHNGDENCNIPICTSTCQNGGTCVSPDTCKCANGYTGPTCDTVSLCSYPSPCFPGQCSGSPEQCVCSSGFSGSTCLDMSVDYTPSLLQISSSLSYRNGTPSQNIYFYTVRSNDTHSITWSNQKSFNRLDFTMVASFDVNSTIETLPVYPSYLNDLTFGIVQGKIDWTYTLASGLAFTSTFSCPDPKDSNPLETLNCYLLQSSAISVTSGDIFTLTFGVKSGGNRRLINTDDGSIRVNNYNGHSVQDVLQFKFDFDVPVHCIQTSSCAIANNPMKLEQDITKTKIRPSWSGWSDVRSGVLRYSFEVWKLDYVVNQDGLQEPLITAGMNPVPLFIAEVNSDSLTFPEYEPSEPGVYSCILEINDRANNSEYARRVVLYDPVSEITVNTSTPMYISSASAETNFVWYTNYNPESTTTVSVNWFGFFSNHLHDENHYLSKVLDYQQRLSDNIWRHNYKRIISQFDDHEGGRTVDAIPHIRGITKYEIAHEIISKPKEQPATFGLNILSPLSETSSFEIAARTIGDGDSYQVWVRASDARGDNKSASSVIHFDQSGPEIWITTINYNNGGSGHQFSSSISIISQDLHSGVRNVSFKLVFNDTNEIRFTTDMNVIKQTATECAKSSDCYCVPMGHCCQRTMTFAFDHCLLGVPLEYVENGTYDLQVTSYNTALLPTTTTTTIGRVQLFNGINRYPSPSSMTFVNKTNEAVAIQWTNEETCYKRFQFQFILHKPDNSTRTMYVNKDWTVYKIDDLSPGDTYILEMYTEYGTNGSSTRSIVPLNVTFMADKLPDNDKSNVLTVTIIVTSVFLFILIVIIAAIVLRILLKKRMRRKHSTAPALEPDVIPNGKPPVVKNTPKAITKEAKKLLLVPEKPCLEEPNEDLVKTIFDLDLPKAPYCSHLQPCYPGYCTSDSDVCTCSNGFTGNSCLLFDAQYTPIIHRTNSTLSQHDPITDDELYAYKVGHNSSINIIWSNQENFDMLEILLEASFDQNSTIGTMPLFPNYINDADFGIVEGKILVNFTTGSGSESQTFSCPEASNMQPVKDLQCFIEHEYVAGLQTSSGDTLSLTFVTTSGGKRELTKINDGSIMGIEFYSGISLYQELRFMFDFDVPVHCSQTIGCGVNPMSLEEDVTKTAIRPYWSDWTDELSGIQRYSFEIWRLDYIEDKDGLQEELITDSLNPGPLFISNMVGEDLTFPEFTPATPGVFSCILEINDIANNSEYVRRVVIYDPLSDVTINNSSRLYVSSANEQTDYSWQTEYTLNSFAIINVTWVNLFQNLPHKEGHFLSRVLSYEPRLSDTGRRHNYKRVLDVFDDNEGNRTTSSIDNINGIVRFEINHKLLNPPQLSPPDIGWEIVSPLLENTSLGMNAGLISDGISQQIWIRAFDVLNNSQTETTMVHFDQSPPEHTVTNIEYNIVGGQYAFTSRITFDAFDLHSGMTDLSIVIMLNETNEIRYAENFTDIKKTPSECAGIPGCYCIPKGECFLRTFVLYINNCILGVSIDMIERTSFILILKSHNMATLATTSNFQIGNIKEYQGVNEYSSPTSLTVVNKTNSEVTIQMSNTPSCYERVQTVIYLHHPDNTTQIFNTLPNTTVFIFTSLIPGETYTAELFSEYGNSTFIVRSLLPSVLSFTTAPYCSHLQPCYPGYCTSDSDVCTCSNVFTGNSCLLFYSGYTPIILSTNSTLSQHDPLSGDELYAYEVGQNSSTIITWSNQENFDLLELSFEASFDPNSTFGALPLIPNYINNVEFGIIEAKILVNFTTNAGTTNEIFQCPEASNIHPVTDLQCFIRHGYVGGMQTSSGDTLSLTFVTTSGGNRELIKINDGTITGLEFYSGISIQQELQFRFDFDVPVHCSQTTTCVDTPLTLEKDVTKTAIRPFWSGWADNISGIRLYSFEIWRLNYTDDDDGLREPLITESLNPVPLFISRMDDEDFEFPEYVPVSPGVFSCILEINDVANNSEYVRRIVIYDPLSDVTMNNSSRLIVASANEATDFSWQTEYTLNSITSIRVTWKDLFHNLPHKEGHFLSLVLPFEPRLSDNGRRQNYKRILENLDDHEGDRTTNAIDNINGIVRFQINNQISKLPSDPPNEGWEDLLSLTENTTLMMNAGLISDGVSQQIWIKAFDIMNNTKTETTIVHFDQSPPEHVLASVQYNIVGGEHAFTSRITFDAFDVHSGIADLYIVIMLNETNEIRYKKNITGILKSADKCAGIPGCYCIPKGECFLRTFVLDINNCLLGVPIDMIDMTSFVLIMTSHNMASLTTTTRFQIGDITQYQGINSYSSPTSVSVVNKTNSEVTIQMSNTPSCYERVQTVIHLYHPDNTTQMFNTSTDTAVYTFMHLTPGETYTANLFSEYGNLTYQVMSVLPSVVSFTTETFCSHLQPCYPGYCKSYIDECICSNSFSGASCQNLDSQYVPIILNTMARLSLSDSNSQLYSFTVDSASGDSFQWSNRKDFNMLQLTSNSSFDVNATIGILPAYPNYIRDVQFGIIEGVILLSHINKERDRNNTSLYCSGPSPLHPLSQLDCNIILTYQRHLESGDILNITFVITSGGFRKLINIGDDSITGIEFYNGYSAHGSQEFRFDFDNPAHCLTTVTCDGKIMQLEKDITTESIRPFWSGWTDDLSGIKSYTFEVWKMEYNSSRDGFEEFYMNGTYKALFTSQTMASSVEFPGYTPTEPGIYSCILEVTDAANNTEYVRRIALYDNLSKVTTNTSYRLYISSALIETDYMWQTDYNLDDITNIDISWQDLFANYLHEQENLLSKILDFKPQLIDGNSLYGYKRILPVYDDNEGDRMRNSIPNINGIVKFEINHEIVSKARVQPSSNIWTNVLPLSQNASLKMAENTLRDGNSLQVWVRAFDIMDNSKTETTLVYFDMSGPEIFLTNVLYNTNGEYLFTSRFTLISRDLASGVTDVTFKLLLNETNEVRYRTNTSIQTETSTNCARSPDCYCINTGMCFMQRMTFDVDNCLLGVHLDLIDSGVYLLEISSTNTATLSTSVVFQLQVKDFAGINKYPSPSEIQFSNKTDTSVTFQWKNIPTCYERVGYIVRVYDPSNATISFEIASNVTKYTITQLAPAVTYGLEMFTVYGNGTYSIISPEPLNITFDTSEADVQISESSGVNLFAIIIPCIIVLIILTIIAAFIIRKLEKKRRKNRTIAPMPDGVGIDIKRQKLQRLPSPKLSRALLTVPERITLDKANEKLETNIFDMSLPKGRAKTLPPLPPISSQLNGFPKKH